MRQNYVGTIFLHKRVIWEDFAIINADLSFELETKNDKNRLPFVNWKVP